MSDDSVEIIPAWLEFHDMEVSGIRWEGDTLIVAFSFGTVWNEAYTYSSYRIGKIVFAHATLTGAFPEEYDEDTYVSTGDIYADSEKLSNLPIPGTSSTTTNIRTRFHFVGWQEPKITSESITISLLGLYEPDAPASSPIAS